MSRTLTAVRVAARAARSTVPTGTASARRTDTGIDFV